jgi:tetratricopeptide (TPR) repeat protein
VEAHYNLGVALQLDEKFDEAAGHYGEALKIRPEYAQAHYNLAIALIAQDKSEEAIAHLNKALTLEPSLAKDHPEIPELLKSGR